MSNGIDFKAMALDLRAQLNACEQSKADLLEALENLLFAYEDPGNEGGTHDDKVLAAKSAIARARGEA